MKIRKLAVFLLIIVLWTCSHISASSASTWWPNSWALIEEPHTCDQLWVETSFLSLEAWDELVQMYHDGSEMWVGGIVELYDNEWGFRFDPDTIIVAEFVAEAAQTRIEWISEHRESWQGGLWYVDAVVVEVRGSPDVNRDLVINVVDLTIVSLAYGSFEGDPGYNPDADITYDGFVDMRDLSRVARHLGQFVG